MPGEARKVRDVMQADEVLLQEAERLLNGANVHVGRTLMCRYVSECWLGKKPELINALHDELSQWIAAEIRKNRNPKALMATRRSRGVLT